VLRCGIRLLRRFDANGQGVIAICRRATHGHEQHHDAQPDSGDDDVQRLTAVGRIACPLLRQHASASTIVNPRFMSPLSARRDYFV
jgi:hypothetical protein